MVLSIRHPVTIPHTSHSLGRQYASLSRRPLAALEAAPERSADVCHLWWDSSSMGKLLIALMLIGMAPCSSAQCLSPMETHSQHSHQRWMNEKPKSRLLPTTQCLSSFNRPAWDCKLITEDR